jgi:hypothetical protein
LGTASEVASHATKKLNAMQFSDVKLPYKLREHLEKGQQSCGKVFATKMQKNDNFQEHLGV